MNQQMWNLYKESDRGKKCIEMFNPETENIYDGIKAILNFSLYYHIFQPLQLL